MNVGPRGPYFPRSLGPHIGSMIEFGPFFNFLQQLYVGVHCIPYYIVYKAYYMTTLYTLVHDYNDYIIHLTTAFMLLDNTVEMMQELVKVNLISGAGFREYLLVVL